MNTGYVFKTQAEGFFGILSYSPTTVHMRIIESTSVREACTMLSEQFAGHFKPADLDQELWGRAVFAARGAPLLTDN